MKTLLLFPLLLALPSLAAPVVLQVEAPQWAGQHIRLSRYADLFTGHRLPLAEADLDAQGRATLQAEVEGTCKGLIRVGPVGADVWLRPGSYHLVLPAPPAGQALPIGGSTRVDPVFQGLSALDVNALMTDLNERLDAFIAQDLATDNAAGMAEVAKVRAGQVQPAADSTRGPLTIYTGPGWSPARTDSFAAKLRKFYAGVDDPWFQSNVEYGLAGLYLGPRADDRALYGQWFQGRAVLYDVPEYVRFFSNFYAGRMMRWGYGKDPDRFLAAVRAGQADSLKAMLARNDLMRDPRVNELVLITGLQAEWGNKEFDRSGVLAVLREVRSGSTWPEHRKLAAHMLEELTAMQPGSALPYVHLLDPEGATATPAWPAGPACLFITTPGCAYCDQEMAALTLLHKEYGAYADFTAIMAPADSSSLAAWLHRHPEAAALAWYRTTRVNELLEDLHVHSVPAMILLRDGKIEACPGPLPSQGLKAVLHSMQVKADEERRLRPDRGVPPPKR